MHWNCSETAPVFIIACKEQRYHWLNWFGDEGESGGGRGVYDIMKWYDRGKIYNDAIRYIERKRKRDAGAPLTSAASPLECKDRKLNMCLAALPVGLTTRGIHTRKLCERRGTPFWMVMARRNSSGEWFGPGSVLYFFFYYFRVIYFWFDSICLYLSVVQVCFFFLAVKIAR